MSYPVPLVRAAALFPFLIWMREHRLDQEARLRRAGLPAVLDPESPIALLAGTRFLVEAYRSEGPDLGCRVVSDTSIAQLATFGRVALGAGSPRGAFKRLAQAYAHHSSHERFVVTQASGGLTILHSFATPMDDETLHACHQYIAAMLRAVCAGTGYRGARLKAVSMLPHPATGLEHLRGRLDVEVEPAASRTLSVTLPNAALDRPYLRPARDRGSAADLSPIRSDGSLTASLRAILPGMLEVAAPSVADLAALAATSPRTFQRRLSAEGVTLTGLIDEIRREQALDRLRRSREPVGAIAAELGYSAQSSLTRAMRRWEREPPSAVRRRVL